MYTFDKVIVYLYLIYGQHNAISDVIPPFVGLPPCILGHPNDAQKKGWGMEKVSWSAAALDGLTTRATAAQ